MALKAVFLSSTAKDLEQYRQAAYQAIGCLEGYHCVRMEDFGARDSAPIDLCTRKVQECDVFVGIVGHLYGSCPEGGEKSYTELEFETAIAACKPRIMLLATDEFRIPAGLMEESTRQERQKQFRSRVQQDRCLRKFSMPDEVALGVVAGLYNLEFDVSRTSASMAASGKPTPDGGAASPASSPAVTPLVAESEVSKQRVDAADALRQSLTTNDLDSVPTGAGSITDFQVARLFLSVKTLFWRHCSSETLSCHEANAIYTHRLHLKAGGWEMDLLWETLLGKYAGTVPGWYWCKDLSSESLATNLWFLAIHARDDEVRVNALSLLRKTRTPMLQSGVGAIEVCKFMLSGKSTETQKAFLEYLAEIGTPQSLELIGDVLRNGSAVIADAATKAKWRILARTVPETLFEELLQSPEPSPDLVPLVRPIIQQLADATLVGGATHTAKITRQLSLEELARRNRLAKELALSLLSDESLRIREICLRRLVELGESLDSSKIRASLDSSRVQETASPLFAYCSEESVNPDDVVYHLFESRPPDELMRRIDWIDLDGHIAYRVLAERHFGQMSVRVRADLVPKQAYSPDREVGRRA